MKILFPHGEVTKEEIEEILRFAIEGRKRVKDQLMRIDSTYSEVHFEYEDQDGKKVYVATLEEKEYTPYYRSSTSVSADNESSKTNADVPLPEPNCKNGSTTSEPKEGHYTFQENQRGVSFDRLLGIYLKEANLRTKG
jgi:ATP-dependent Lon protease